MFIVVNVVEEICNNIEINKRYINTDYIVSIKEYIGDKSKSAIYFSSNPSIRVTEPMHELYTKLSHLKLA